MTLSDELRPGGTRPGPRDAWARFDLVEQLLEFANDGPIGRARSALLVDVVQLEPPGLAVVVVGLELDRLGPASPAVADYTARAAVEPDSKRRVATRAAALIEPGNRVILDGGTTTLAVVKALAPSLSATVITHSPAIAAALVEHRAIDVFLIGGQLFKHSAVTCGAAAAEAARTISADLFFLGVTGVHPTEGLTTGDADEAAMKRLLASRAAETYVLASTEKIGAASPYSVLPLKDVTAVITDAADSPIIARLERAGTHIISAATSRVARDRS